MRLHKVLVLLVGSFVLVGGASYFFGGQQAAAPTVTDIEGGDNTAVVVTAAQPTIPLVGTGTLSMLETLDGSYACFIEFASSDVGVVQGTLYIDTSKMVRGDLAVERSGQLTSTQFIQRDEMMYHWTNAAGVITAIVVPTSDTSVPRPLMDTTEFTYACERVTPDEQRFIVPTDITFINQTTT